MIKLIQHVNNSSLYIDACAHGNSVYPVVIQPQSLQQQSMRYIYYKSVILYLDGLIRRYRVLALTVWGPLLPSPMFRTRGGGVMIQTVEAVNSMSLSKGDAFGGLSRPIVRSHPCAPSVCKLLLQYPGPFYHRYTFPRLIPSKVAEI